MARASSACDLTVPDMVTTPLLVLTSIVRAENLRVVEQRRLDTRRDRRIVHHSTCAGWANRHAAAAGKDNRREASEDECLVNHAHRGCNLDANGVEARVDHQDFARDRA